jgi:hypothetical protein
VAAAGESESSVGQMAVVLEVLLKGSFLVAEEVMVAGSAYVGSGVEGASVVDFEQEAPSQRLLGGSKGGRIWLISNRCAELSA